MANGMEKFIRPDLLKLGGYSAAKSPDTLAGKVAVPVERIIKLDANENPYGCSPRVSRALADYPLFNIYPDAGQTELRKQLAGYAGAYPEQIVASNGSNQLIDLILRLAVSPGDEVINCVPTFDIYRFSTQICGGKLIEVPRDSNFAVNVPAVRAVITERTRVLFLANPNNPTGNLTPREDIIALLETGLPLVVDEAYYEFSGETVLPLMAKYGNLMVLRTFSKWAGLAGLRVGFGVFPPQIAAYLMTVKIPYNVSAAAQLAVYESLRDVDYLMASVRAIIAERARLMAELRKIKWLQPFPSRANFILCRVLGGRAKELQQAMQDKGILLRYFDAPQLRDYIRISVGKPEHTDALIQTFKAVRSD